MPPLCKGETCSKLQKRKKATFNISGMKPEYCKTCIPLGSQMIDVVNKKCEKCSKQPTYGFESLGARFCKDHKENDMIDIKNKKCQKCSKRPLYGLPGGSAIFCKDHKEDDMIDVISKKCQKCSKIPSFGLPGKSAIFCKDHKEDDMIDNKAPKCNKCSKLASYGLDGEPPRFCMDHKEMGMVNVTGKICAGYIVKCPVRTRLSRDNKYCLSCDPDEERQKRFKKYENSFFEYVKDKLDIYKREFHVKFDPNQTSKLFARIDGIIFGDAIIVCLEVDENGHRDYDCDEHRMHLVNGELLQTYSGSDIAWIRVNPHVPGDDQWSPESIILRKQRFDEVVDKANDILETKRSDLIYIGF